MLRHSAQAHVSRRPQSPPGPQLHIDGRAMARHLRSAGEAWYATAHLETPVIVHRPMEPRRRPHPPARTVASSAASRRGVLQSVPAAASRHARQGPPPAMHDASNVRRRRCSAPDSHSRRAASSAVPSATSHRQSVQPPPHRRSRLSQRVCESSSGRRTGADHRRQQIGHTLRR